MRNPCHILPVNRSTRETRVMGRCSLVLAVIIAVLAFAPAAHADYLVVSRHALVKSTPDRNADTLLVVERDATLALMATEQTHGYYQVELDDGDEGWVYRTFVRRVAGNRPGTPVIGGGPTTSASTAGAPATTAYSGLPVSVDPDFPVKVLNKGFFTIGYSEERRDPLWVCYAIGPAVDLKAYPRRAFATDQSTGARVSTSDYNGSGFSRGHMAPRFAISSRFGKAGNDATFVMSNVCPQFQSYNDGQWGNLEEWIAGKKVGTRFIKGWADVYENVWVIVGPIFDEDREPVDSVIEVPNAFYCIVVDDEGGTPRALAFILDHVDERDHDLTSSMTSIDEIEARTGLDFLKDLPDQIEVSLESSASTALWPLPQNPN